MKNTLYRMSMHDFPTPEFPIRSTLKSMSLSLGNLWCSHSNAKRSETTIQETLFSLLAAGEVKANQFMMIKSPKSQTPDEFFHLKWRN